MFEQSPMHVHVWRTRCIALTRLAIALGSVGLVTACSASVSDATRGYAKAIADVAAATKEDVNRCEHSETDEERATFCERARKHCDMIQTTADDLAKSAK